MANKTKLIMLLVYLISYSGATTADEIIRKEKLAFEKCLKVIITSEERLGIGSKIVVDEANVRVVEFKMSDGVLSILQQK